MSIYIVSYDLGWPETSASYKKLHEKIQSLWDCRRPLESFYLVKSDRSPASIRDELRWVLDGNDKLLVAKTQPWLWASYNIGQSGEWLKIHSV
jgi:hypothetical protein